jgi:hypothetical protein
MGMRLSAMLGPIPWRAELAGLSKPLLPHDDKNLNMAALSKFISDRRLAPFWRPVSDATKGAAECPLCMQCFPRLNKTHINCFEVCRKETMSVWHGPAVFGAPVRAGKFIDERCVDNLVNEMMHILEVNLTANNGSVPGRVAFPIFVITKGRIPRTFRRTFFVTGVLADLQFNLELLGEQDFSKSATPDWPEVFSQPVEGGEVRPAVKKAFIRLLQSQPDWLDVDAGWKMHPLVKLAPPGGWPVPDPAEHMSFSDWLLLQA